MEYWRTFSSVTGMWWKVSILRNNFCMSRRKNYLMMVIFGLRIWWLRFLRNFKLLWIYIAEQVNEPQNPIKHFCLPKHSYLCIIHQINQFHWIQKLVLHQNLFQKPPFINNSTQKFNAYIYSHPFHRFFMYLPTCSKFFHYHFQNMR